MEWNGIKICLKADSSADHSAKTGAARPATTDLTFGPYTSVWTTDGHATGAAVAVVVGVERAGETRGGSPGVGVRDTNRLHRRSVRGREGFKERFMILYEKIVLC